MNDWGDKQYYSLNYYLKQKYGEKIYKLALNGGMTCPNRDGTIDTRGCLFCSAGGSGEFAEGISSGEFRQAVSLKLQICDNVTVLKQLEAAKQRLSQKQTGNKYIAYFQAYSNTYASVEYLQQLFQPIIEQEEIVGLSIGTRPDCLPDEVLDLLAKLNQIKPVWVELGLQTIHERTAERIRRGYKLSCFNNAVCELRQRHLNVIVHLIFGLPGESKQDMLESVKYMNTADIQGVKLQLLHILKGTDLASEFLSGNTDCTVLSMEAYIDIICDAIAELSPEIVIHRLTGDGPKNLLIAPKWSTDKKRVLNTIHKELALRGIYQGCRNEKRVSI